VVLNQLGMFLSDLILVIIKNDHFERGIGGRCSWFGCCSRHTARHYIAVGHLLPRLRGRLPLVTVLRRRDNWDTQPALTGFFG